MSRIIDLPAQLLRDAVRATTEKDYDAKAIEIADAALRQFELFGVARSTIDDIARGAKVSRVTVYRRFPGRDALINAVTLRELRRFLADLDGVVEPLEEPDEMLIEGFLFTLDAMRSNRLLQRLLESEPETVLPYLTTNGSPLICAGRDYLAGYLIDHAREWEDDDRGEEELLTVAEIVVRLVLSFLLTPQTTVDLDDPEKAREFALRYLRPLLFGNQS
jgi:AcrR family transcriptional regulator